MLKIRLLVVALLMLVVGIHSPVVAAQDASPAATPTVDDPCAGPMVIADATPVVEAEIEPATLDLDVLYLELLIPHQEVTIAMARVAQARSTRTEVVSLAAEIVDARTRELDQMLAWRGEWYADLPPLSEAQVFAGLEAKVASPGRGGAPGLSDLTRGGMTDALRELCEETDRFDLALIDALVEHESAAVLISQLAADLAVHPELGQLAREIVDTRSARIAQLLEWRDLWFGGVPLDEGQTPDGTPAS